MHHNIKGCSFFLILLVFIVSCIPKKTSEASADLKKDSVTVKLMPDTIAGISNEKPLIIRDPHSFQPMPVFPYTLIFPGEKYDVYLVSFRSLDPTLITLDKNLTVIDSLSLMGDIPIETEELLHKRFVRIAGSAAILIVDTIRMWSLDNASKRDPASRKEKRKTQSVQIATDGKILSIDAAEGQ